MIKAKKIFIPHVGSVLVMTGAIVFTLCIPVHAADQLAKLDQGGLRILTIVRRIGYWIILVKAVTDVVRAGINGDTHSIGKIVFTYVIIYGALFFIPWALKLVEGIF